MSVFTGFAIGAYVTGAAFTFVPLLAFTALGGRSEDAWKPFVYAALWPITVPVILFRGGVL